MSIYKLAVRVEGESYTFWLEADRLRGVVLEKESSACVVRAQVHCRFLLPVSLDAAMERGGREIEWID